MSAPTDDPAQNDRDAGPPDPGSPEAPAQGDPNGRISVAVASILFCIGGMAVALAQAGFGLLAADPPAAVIQASLAGFFVGGLGLCALLVAVDQLARFLRSR